MKIDIENFFGSCERVAVRNLLLDLGYTLKVAELLSRLVTYHNELPQGSPASPSIANHLLYAFDEKMLSYAKLSGLRYSRYSDDITFSGPALPTDIVPFVKSSLAAFNFKVKEEKTRILHRSNRQIITGVVVNDKMNTPRPNRRRLRQEAYYIKKFGLDAHIERLNIVQPNYLERLIAISGFNCWINKDDTVSKKARDILVSVKSGSRKD